MNDEDRETRKQEAIEAFEKPLHTACASVGEKVGLPNNNWPTAWRNEVFPGKGSLSLR